MSVNEKFIFLPLSPETLSRVLVEARMLGCSISTNSLVGATSEKWFSLKGEKLIDFFINKREEIANTIEDIIQTSNKDKERPKISIISTFYKAETFLDEFLNDLTSQTIFKECELILIDSASPGNEKEIVSKYTSEYDNIIYKRYEELFPPTEGHNIAMKMASGKYITWAMIDDRKRKDNLEILYKTLEKNPDVDLVYGDCLVTNVKNEKFEDTKSIIKSEHSIPEFSPENMVKCLPGPMPMWTRKMLNTVGFFNQENQNFCDDWEMWLRCVSHGFKFKKVNEIIGLYLQGGRSQLDNNIEQRKEEAALFLKYGNLFGNNFNKFYPYFKQFADLT
jgi:glycosyltransferase involved in cell wall biosynthesis